VVVEPLHVVDIKMLFLVVCKDTRCSDGKKCVPNKLMPPTCKCPTEDDCPRDYEPVCGSDKKTYINHCRLRVEACKTGQTINVAKKGVCGKNSICSRGIQR